MQVTHADILATLVNKDLTIAALQQKVAEQAKALAAAQLEAANAKSLLEGEQAKQQGESSDAAGTG